MNLLEKEGFRNNLLKIEGFMNNTSVSIFTKTRPVIIVPKGNPAKIQNITDLAKPGLKIVIGTKDVPIGDYTLQILSKLPMIQPMAPIHEERLWQTLYPMRPTSTMSHRK